MKYLIVKNSCVCLNCKEEITSDYGHNFVTCKCGKVSIDGGHGYQRILGFPEDYKITSITIENTPESLEANHFYCREHFTWGTYGKDGNQRYQRVKIKDLETPHIHAILKTQPITGIIRMVIQNELQYRKELNYE